MTAVDRLLKSRPDLRPFDLGREDDYRWWREAKLADRAAGPQALIVEVADPASLTGAEHGAMLERIRRFNMAVYAAPGTDNVLAPGKALVRRVGEQFGLNRLDANYLSDEDGISPITVHPGGTRTGYIPYTNRPIQWHTDGYYNPPSRQVRAMLLHCVRSAARGGANGLLDPELLYLRLRDEEPRFIRALMGPKVMTIPPGRDNAGGQRGATAGPVFSVDVDCCALHTRFTARKRNVDWAPDRDTQSALAHLVHFLAGDDVLSVRLEPGMGLVCNNVLHTREAFVDTEGEPPRLLYRARYLDRIAGSVCFGAA